MTISSSPGLLVALPGRASAATLQRVFLVQDGTDADTDEPVITLSPTGPATYAYTFDDVNDALLLDDDEAATGALKTVVSGGSLVLYT